MRLVELDIAGVYIDPMSALLAMAWLVTISFRRMAARLGVLQHVWHPALFIAAIYVIVLSSMFLAIAR